ncbi:unnamed protein product [Angiostrongylus costaricensis]|uniref:Protein muscleblind n=1 Tax=Angiostrongylus costaricensis TaxID=334426 RepID=A0A0R3PCA7_ANGCS|nr:unnamed protein product [Angiostrongylus costaricensis]
MMAGPPVVAAPPAAFAPSRLLVVPQLISQQPPALEALPPSPPMLGYKMPDQLSVASSSPYNANPPTMVSYSPETPSQIYQVILFQPPLKGYISNAPSAKKLRLRH